MTRFCTVCFTLLFVGVLNADETKMKALIVDGQNNHNWKATTPVLQEYLEQTGLFTVAVATTGSDIAQFQPKFADFDVVVMNYNGADWSQETQASFVNYV